MAGDKSRKCPTCQEVKSGRKFKNSEQCTECRRDIDRAHHPLKCRKCPQLFSRDTFHFEKTGRGWRKECKTCHGQQQKNHNADRENQPPRVCKRCDVEKAATEFKDQRLMCTACKLEEDRKKAALIPKANPETLDKPSTCQRCQKPMGPEGLTLRQDTHLGSYRSLCKICLATAKDGSNHSQNSRKRQRERPDWSDIKRHKNGVQQEWKSNNTDKMQAYASKYRADAQCKMRQIKQSALSRGMIVVEEDEAAMTESILEPCFYCHFQPGEGEPVNGLDRVDSSIKEYSWANTVPCCPACNHIKGSRCLDQFLLHAKSVRSCAEPCDGIATDQQYRSQCCHGTPPQKRDHLTDEERRRLHTQQCTYCDVVPACGVDRLVSAEDYTSSNSQPCCQECNYSKSAVSPEAFMSQMGRIRQTTSMWVLGSCSDAKDFMGRSMQPVACWRGSVLLGVFASQAAAVTSSTESSRNISDAITSGNDRRGLRWAYVTYTAYRGSCVDPEAASTIMKPTSHRGRSEEQHQRKREVAAFEDEAGHVLQKQYASVREAARELHCAASTISQALDKPRRAKGLYWKEVK